MNPYFLWGHQKAAYAFASAVVVLAWLQIPVDYGIVGFVWLFLLFAVFFLLFLVSFYQRPVIWLPVPLLHYLAGLGLSRKAA